jgi:hypothetical protein
MELKKVGKELDRVNYFRNIALKALNSCVKSYDEAELSEEEQTCLKEKSLLLHHIVDNNDINKYVLYGSPKNNYYFP